MIPDPVMVSGLSLGAKVCYGVLARFAGENGECFPTVQTIGARIGVSERQARSYLRELEGGGYIRRINGGDGRPNRYAFLWHESFNGSDRKDSSGGGGRILPPEESQLRENTDLDYLTTNRKKHDSPSGGNDVTFSCTKEYPRLREALRQYFQEDGQEDLTPANRLVADVVDAAGGATEQQVIDCLRYLYYERGLRPGTRNGPRHWAWFKTTVAEYFACKRAREGVVGGSACDYGLSPDEFDRMTDAIEIEGSV